MNRLALILVLMMFTALGSAAESNNDDLVTKMCSDGVPWNLPIVEGEFRRSEVYLHLNGDSERTMRICHCTEDVDGSSVYIWVVATGDSAPVEPSQDEQKALESYFNQRSVSTSLLKGRGCLDARGKSILIHHMDKNNVRWGTYFSPVEITRRDK